jgi:hypothetical protein
MFYWQDGKRRSLTLTLPYRGFPTVVCTEKGLVLEDGYDHKDID